MGKLHVVHHFCKDLCVSIEHTNVVMEHKAGTGGGQHLLRDIWDSRQDEVKEQKGLHTAHCKSNDPCF